MKIFKSNVWTKLKHVGYSVCIGAFVSILVRLITENSLIIYSVSIASCMFMLYTTLIGERIKVILDDNTMKVFVANKLKHKYNLNEVTFDSYIKNITDSTGSSSDCTLTIINNKTNEKEFLNCSMLGVHTYYKLIEALKINQSEDYDIIPA